MKKTSAMEKLRYNTDKLLSKGTGVLVLILATITVVVVISMGLLMLTVDGNYAKSAGDSLWSTFMYAIDAGTLAGYTATPSGIIILAITTLCGIFITSMLIGILNSGLEAKLDGLRRGTSKVIEQNHTVIIGFNENTFTIISELIIANENRKKPVIVVLGNDEKSLMEEMFANRIADTKNTSVIFRSGATADITLLRRCSVETAKSIIINIDNDAEVIKSILAINHILKDAHSDAYITASVSSMENVEAARIAGQGRAEIVYFKSAISRIIANTCHQPGLSKVYSELFDFDGDEIYIENSDALVGKRFCDILNMYPVSTVIGLKKGADTMLNPPMDTLVEQGDGIILVAADDGISNPQAAPQLNDAELAAGRQDCAKQSERFLVLGYNELLHIILDELDNYVEEGSSVLVAVDKPSEDYSAQIEKERRNFHVVTKECDICSGEELRKLLQEDYRHIIVLSDFDIGIEEADAKTLVTLLHLKNISRESGKKYSIISQMLSAENGELAKVADVNDFVISTNLASLMLSQISENRNLAPIFDDILDADGSELYMKPASRYVKTGVPVSMFSATSAGAQYGEIVLGYKKIMDSGEADIVTNPPKSSMVTFNNEDCLIVIAQEG